MVPFHIPLEFAELLHATLGPLEAQLAKEGHPWANMVRRVLSEYTSLRNSHLSEFHGPQVIADVKHETFLASERVCEIATLAVTEVYDFAEWAMEVDKERLWSPTEVSGETA